MSLTIGDNGIISRAQESTRQTDIADTKEQIVLELLAIQTDNLGSYTEDDVWKAVDNVLGEGSERDKDNYTVQSAKGNTVDISDLIYGASDYSADSKAPTISVEKEISSNNLTVSVTAEDESGIYSYEYYLDGTSVKEDITDSTSSTYTFESLSEGTHTVKVVVTDTYGNEAEEEITVIIDTKGPSVAISTSISYDSDTADITASVTATDTNGIASYEYYLDTSLKQTNSTSSTSNSYTYESLEYGETYTIKVIVTDSLGNKSEISEDVEIPSLISFSLDGTTYYAVEGMTWYEWLNDDNKYDGSSSGAQVQSKYGFIVYNNSQYIYINYGGGEDMGYVETEEKAKETLKQIQMSSAQYGTSEGGWPGNCEIVCGYSYYVISFGYNWADGYYYDDYSGLWCYYYSYDEYGYLT